MNTREWLRIVLKEAIKIPSGLLQYRKQQKALKEMIQQIEEMTAE